MTRGIDQPVCDGGELVSQPPQSPRSGPPPLGLTIVMTLAIGALLTAFLRPVIVAALPGMPGVWMAMSLVALVIMVARQNL